jgi:hypothetical protein
MNDFVPTYGSMIILSWHSLNLGVSVMPENLLISNGQHGKFTFIFVTFVKIIGSNFSPIRIFNQRTQAPFWSIHTNFQSANTGTFLKYPYEFSISEHRHLSEVSTRFHRDNFCGSITRSTRAKATPFLQCVIVHTGHFLKETVSRDGFGFWWHVWLLLELQGLNRGRGQFWNFNRYSANYS